MSPERLRASPLRAREHARSMDLCFEPPLFIDAGTSIDYRASLASLGYSASDGWSLKFYLFGPPLPVGSDLRDGISGTADGDSFLVSVGPAITADLTPGLYTWVELVTDGTLVKTARKGSLRVEPGITAAIAGALQSSDEIELALIDARIQERLAKDAATIEGFDKRIIREQLELLYKRQETLRTRIASRQRGRSRREPERIAFVEPR